MVISCHDQSGTAERKRTQSGLWRGEEEGEVDEQAEDAEVEGSEKELADGVEEVVNKEEEQLEEDVQEYGAEGRMG